jgi:hypothetical protein
MQETSEKLTQVLEEFGLNQNQIDRAIESINPVCKPDDVSFMVQEIEKRRERLKIPKLQMCREMDISDNTYRS